MKPLPAPRTPAFVLCAAIALGLGLMSVTAAHAQSNAPSSDDATNLPDALSNLMVVTYACQSVSGPEPYAKARDMAHSVVQSMSDAATADQFVADEEKNAKGACADTKTCWQNLLDDGVAPTPANAKSTCDDYIDLAGTAAAKLIDQQGGSGRS